MKFLLMLLILFLFSCTPHTSLMMDKEKIVGFSDLGTNIDSIQISKWHVGDHHAKELHKGFIWEIGVIEECCPVIASILTLSG